jgi:hypothetical protein
VAGLDPATHEKATTEIRERRQSLTPMRSIARHFLHRATTFPHFLQTIFTFAA